MEQRDMERLRQKLELQRDEARQFLRRMEHEAKSLDAEGTQDSADLCAVNLSKEFLFERSSERTAVLRLIDAALTRMSDGSFGLCVACGDQISGRRLEALPWTQFCLQCQEALEERVGASLAARALPKAATWRRAG